MYVFSAIFQKGDNFWKISTTFLHEKPLLKRSILKEKEFVPIGANFAQTELTSLGR